MKPWNTLWVRLTLALTLGILIAVGGIAALIRQTTDVEFRQYITHSGMRLSDSGAQRLATYYRTQGSWQGVESLLGEGIEIGRMPGMPGMSGMSGGRLDVMLADANGKVIFDSADEATGDRLSTREKSRALPITSLEDNSQVIGYLLLSLPGRGDALGTLEQRFLERVQNALLIAGAIAVALGLVAGALLSRGLTAPLQRLASAARAVGRGDLGIQVKVEGSAEIAEVSQAFNEMIAALEEGERLRQNLMVDVAHELRTPLSVLQGNLRALLDDVYPMEKVEIARLYDETRLLSRLIDDLRELSVAEAGQLTLNLQPTDATEAIRNTAANFEPAAEAKQIELSVDLSSNLPFVRADVDRLGQVLRNLLTNALRHTGEGGRIAFSAKPIGDAVEIAVADTGEGISPDDLPRVFDRFWRAEPSRSRGEGGAGLGLAIVKAIVEAHGGQVSAHSDGLGQGSTFKVSLPLA